MRILVNIRIYSKVSVCLSICLPVRKNDHFLELHFHLHLSLGVLRY